MSNAATLPVPVRRPARWRTWHPLGHLGRVSRDPLAFFEEARRLHGDAVWLRMAGADTLHLFRPDYVHHLLVAKNKQYTKTTRGYQILRTLLGLGLLTAEGKHWQRQRRIARPAFKKGIIDGFGATMVEEAERLCDEWDRAAAAGVEVDVNKAMSALTLRVACRTLFSHDIGPVEEVVSEGLDDMIAAFDGLVTSPLPYPWKWPLRANRTGQAAVARLHAVVDRIVAERRRTGELGDDLLGLLMGAVYEDTGEPMSDEQLRAEVLTMLLAGHETTANALTFALYLLSQRPRVADELAQNIGEAIGDARPSFADYGQLEPVGRVVNESLRLYPPVWTLARMAQQDDEIDGIKVPKGTMVFISPWVLHRHPGFWADPDVFDPDRWSPERSAGRAKLAYFPFSTGSRKCIGEHFALLEARLLLATLARRYQGHLRPGHKLELETSVTLRVANGLPMTLTRR
ncbi:MAG: cytochrome P450 [Myxococcota bacterium]